jgi:hypothetical protein
MIATVTQHNENQIAISFPFNNDAKEALKSAIEWQKREFHGKSKSWLVANDCAAAAVAAIAPYFDVVDARKGEDVEEAQINAEIAQIQENQAKILAAQEWIGQRVSDLNTLVSRYSYRSQSSVKAGLARDAALLRHSIENARQPLESLTELQVRGLAAAVRYIENPPRI